MMTSHGRPDVTHDGVWSFKDVFEGEAIHDFTELREISTTLGIPLSLTRGSVSAMALDLDHKQRRREVKVDSGDGLISYPVHDLAGRSWYGIHPAEA